MNKLTYSTAKAITERCGMKKKSRNRTNHKQPAWKRKIQEEIEAFRGELSILEDLSKGVNVKTRKGQKVKRKYKLQNENDITTAKEKIKQKVQVKAQRIRRFEKGQNFTGRIKYLRLMRRNYTGRWENNPSKLKSLLL